MPSVVVTGVAGSVGSRVAALLVARPDIDRVIGIDVVPVSWAHPKLEVRLLDLAAQPRQGDPELKTAFDGASGLIHLAWKATDGPVGLPDDDAITAAINRNALRRVLSAASSTSPDEIVHLSSATVYGAWPDNKIPLTEDARLRPNPEFSFAVSKAEAERVLAEWADENPSVRVAVLRPAVTVGPEERPLYQALGATRAPRSGDGGRPVQYLHVDDLARAVVLAWEKSLCGVYNVAPDSGIREEDARALAGGVAKLPLPARLAEQVADWGWHLLRKGVPAEARAYASNPWVVGPDRLKAEGWEPQYTSEEALVATDARLHWDDLPPGRRQNYNLVIALIALAGITAGAGAVVAAILRRRRNRS